MQAGHTQFLELLNGQKQYIVPRWQRRYTWGQREIERLVEDLLTVALAQADAGHYGGTLLTFAEPGPEGVVKSIRVVDGQQRLTTVSILLAAIAEKLGPDGECDGWTAAIIRDDRLTNPGKSTDKIRKLRLQGGDEEEYRNVLAGNGDGAGAVAQAARTIRRLVAKHDPHTLLRGLQRLRVVSIGLEANEDPQQIFESLNATGRPLTESEKVKNWLLMGLPDAEQQELHDDVWLEIEKALGAEHAAKRVDEFLRDLLRWKTGRLQGINTVYDELRRWAVRGGKATDRPMLCRELAALAQHYGQLTGAAGAHPNPGVAAELCHLREMGIDVHRPLTMRLLHDANQGRATDAELADALRLVGTWITRIWLADRPLAGLNKATTELAHGPDYKEDENLADYWRERIHRLRNGRAGVPDDGTVREGMQTRTAYGGSVTPTTKAVLCAMMEAEQGPEAPPRAALTVEHVMPQKLTTLWQNDLGDSAEEFHTTHLHRFGNLTLTGFNPELAAKPFRHEKLPDKVTIYKGSSVNMTKRVSDEAAWNEEALERRSKRLADEALKRWPWEPEGQTAPDRVPFNWRINGGEWRAAETASGLVLDVAGALLAHDPGNVERLSGPTLSRDLQSATRFPPNSKAGTLTVRAVPGHEDLVIYPYGSNYPESATRCRQMGVRCGVDVEVVLSGNEKGASAVFWLFLKEHTGGVPGQKDKWRGPSQWTSTLNPQGDRVGIYVGNPELLWLYVRSGLGPDRTAERAAQMREYSWQIQEMMGDQRLGGNLEGDAKNGTSITIERPWVRDDEDEWPQAADWIKEQQERLAAVVRSM